MRLQSIKKGQDLEQSHNERISSTVTLKTIFPHTRPQKSSGTTKIYQ